MARHPLPIVKRTAAGLLVALLLATLTVWLGAAPAQARRQPGVTMSVVDVYPNTPPVTQKPQPLSFTLSLTNNDPTNALDVVVSAVRGDPIGSARQLDSAIATPKAPTPSLIAPLRRTVRVTLGVGVTTQVVLRTSTDTTVHDGVCLCYQNQIYPFWFTADYTSADGRTSGSVNAQTFLPAFSSPPRNKTKVSWMWPLLDRPHRLLQSSVFTDDLLAGEVHDGRLARLLAVLERVSPTVPMTIVTDPDLIDELAVMAHGYKYVSDGQVVTGEHGAWAQQWLARLRTVLDTRPAVHIVFTPFADPAVDSLAHAGMSWSVALDPQVAKRVTDALGRTVLGDIAWPVGRRLGRDTLTQLVSQGANTVVVADRALAGAAPWPTALAHVSTSVGQATVAVTSAPVEQMVHDVLNPYTNGLALLPDLVSRLAIDVITAPQDPRFLVITPPRDLDVNVGVAVRTIEATANSTWAQPITLDTAAQSLPVTERAALRADRRGPQLPAGLLDTLRGVADTVPGLQSLYHDPAVGARLFAPFPAAIQRCESTSLLGTPAAATTLAQRLANLIGAIKSSVYIVKPSDGTYTLTSKNGQLPITVVNRLDAEVDVELSLHTESGVPGLTAGDEGHIYHLNPNTKVQEHIPIHVERPTVIRVVVTIRTVDGFRLGGATRLSVRSTALGTIGVVITVAAAVVLALAVLVRLVRRFRKRPDQPAPGAPPSRVRAPAAR